jgi:hypothetical protein
MMGLFRQIIHELALNKGALVAFGALLSPFVVLVGVIASLLIANKNLKGTLITNQRREWINEVRNEVAGILAALAPLQVDITSVLYATRIINLMGELQLHLAKLTLLMDLKNSAQYELLTVAHDAIQHANDMRKKPGVRAEDAELEEANKLKAAVKAHNDKLIHITQAVLAEAWEKAQSLK